jgi:predicted Rossmann fold flavoprotein
VTGLIGGKRGASAAGELLFTKYGLSGTAVLDVSEEISIALHRHHQKDIELEADLVPFLSEENLREELAGRLNRKWPAEKLTAGMLPPKFGPVAGRSFQDPDAAKVAAFLKTRRFRISGTRGWNEAEFTAGGVDTREVKAGTLESKLQKGLYLAGELLNVSGRRGGYNLAWAWASGFVAGGLG